MGGRVQRQLAAGIDRRQRRAGVFPQPHGHTGQQFLRVKGLGQIVRRAAQQEVDLILHRHLGADHDHGDALQLRQHLLAGQSRQHQVKQHKVGAAVLQQKQRFRPGIGPLHSVALPLQHLLLQIADGHIVVDDQNFPHKTLPFR